ncbi:MAG TPA: amidohydrolase [Burkholderiales bacterium]|nr:amidohydrolase [Burkholderiales bacterium]
MTKDPLAAVQRVGRAAKLGLRLPFLFLIAAALAAASCARTEPVPPADLILTNGVVYTLDPAQPWAEAVAVAADKIVCAGPVKGAGRFRGPSTRTIDLAGKMVLPGFQDSHIHLIEGGVESSQCNLADLETPEEVFAAVKAYAVRNPGRPWITGGRWELPVFPKASPTKEELDKLVPDRPACLYAADGHSAWVNTRALKLAGVTAMTPDPAGGRIERDPRTGEPSGTLRESAADLVAKHIPEPDAAEVLKGLRTGLEMARRLGITSIIEASARQDILDAYAALDRSGEMKLRVLASLYVDTDKGLSEVARLEKLREAYRGRHLRATTAKIFADGVIESHTAALLEPYLDRPNDRGLPLLEPEAFNNLATALDAAGFQIHVHAIGDRAIRMTLDALEAAEKANGARDLRHHIAHLELIDPADIPRFRALGVAANFQPLWAYADPYITKLTLPILGPARSRWLYPIGSVLAAGAVVVGGSDWPVSSANPLDAIQVAVTRRGPDEPPGPAWIPEEVADLPSMIAAYTTHGAYLSHEEDVRGVIAPGKIADLVVLDRNLFKIPPSEVHKARVLLTLFEGQEAWRDPGF